MAVFKNDPFPGTNYGQYLNWEKVTTPQGQTLYVVPGFPAYVYDPVASNASGRKVFRANPSQAIQQQQEQQDQQNKIIKQQQYNQSPAGQLTPVIAGTAGTIGAAYAINQFGKGAPTVSYVDTKTGNTVWSDGSVKTPSGQLVSPPSIPQQVTSPAQAAAQGAKVPVPPAGAVPASTKVSPVGQGTMPDGSSGTIMSDGTVVADSGAMVTKEGSYVPAAQSPLLRGIQGGVGAVQVYQGYQQWKDGDKFGGGLGVTTGAANIAAAAGSATAAQYVPYLNIANDVYQGYGTLTNDQMTGEQKASRLQQQAGLGVADFYTYGAASAAEGLLRKNKTTGKLLGKLDELDQKTNPFTIVAGKFLHGPSTRTIAKQHTGQLFDQAKDDPVYQAYLEGVRAPYNNAPPDPEHPYGDSKGNKYASWDEYVKGGLDAANLAGVYGNLKTYGPSWASLTEDQRHAVTQANIDSGLYKSNKGEVEITNEQKAKENFDNVMKGFQVGAQAAAAPIVTPQAPMGAIQPIPRTVGPSNILATAAAKGAISPIIRTNTRSPGIGLDGRRIVY